MVYSVRIVLVFRWRGSADIIVPSPQHMRIVNVITVCMCIMAGMCRRRADPLGTENPSPIWLKIHAEVFEELESNQQKSLSLFLQKHPRTGKSLLPPRRHDGTPWEPGIGKYLNLKAPSAEIVDDKFYRYVPEDLRPTKRAKEGGGPSMQEKMQVRLQKIRKREAEDKKASSVEVYVQERLEHKLRSIPTRMNLHEGRNLREVNDQETMGDVSLVDSTGHVAKRVRLRCEAFKLS